MSDSPSPRTRPAASFWKEWFGVRRLRRLHLYLGVFFTPILLFFILTGWYQVVNPDRMKSPSEAESLMQRLRTVHVDQIYPAGQEELERPSSPKLFRVLVVVMSIAVTLTILLGLILAFKTSRHLWPVWLSLLLGLLLPILILWLGQGAGEPLPDFGDF